MALSNVKLAVELMYTDTGATTNTAGTPTDALNLGRLLLSLDSGTTANKADRTLSRTSTAFTGSATLILSNYANGYASGLAMVEVVWLYFYNSGTVALEIGPGGTHGWAAMFASTTTVQPGELLIRARRADPAWPVVAGVTDQMLLNCPTGTGAYTLVILGRSA